MNAIEHNEDLVVKVLEEKGGYYHEGKAYLNGLCISPAIDEAIACATQNEDDYWDREEAETFISQLEFIVSLMQEGE